MGDPPTETPNKINYLDLTNSTAKPLFGGSIPPRASNLFKHLHNPLSITGCRLAANSRRSRTRRRLYRFRFRIFSARTLGAERSRQRSPPTPSATSDAISTGIENLCVVLDQDVRTRVTKALLRCLERHALLEKVPFYPPIRSLISFSFFVAREWLPRGCRFLAITSIANLNCRR
jgi:hypothetical protein